MHPRDGGRGERYREPPGRTKGQHRTSALDGTDEAVPPIHLILRDIPLLIRMASQSVARVATTTKPPTQMAQTLRLPWPPPPPTLRVLALMTR